MFIIKRNYYLYIENTKDINLNRIKKGKKISIIYRNNKSQEKIEKLYKFRKQCNIKGFKLYISNNIKLLKSCKADGLYLSSFNKKIYLNKNLNLIGSAHSYKEINEKIKQRCNVIFLSRLFKTSYREDKQHFGLIKFNLLISKYKATIVYFHYFQCFLSNFFEFPLMYLIICLLIFLGIKLLSSIIFRASITFIRTILNFWYNFFS